MDQIAEIVRILSGIATYEKLFNPYCDNRTLPFDRNKAPGTRRQNIRRYLEALSDVVSRPLWIFEAPRRGAVRTGIPQVSEYQIPKASELLLVRPPFQRATTSSEKIGKPSQTSTIVWDAVGDVKDTIPVLWNVCMGLPWKDESPEKFGSPEKSDMRAFAPTIPLLITLFKPDYIIWSGAKARWVRQRVFKGQLLDIEHFTSDHPKKRIGTSDFPAIAGALMRGERPNDARLL